MLFKRRPLPKVLAALTLGCLAAGGTAARADTVSFTGGWTSGTNLTFTGSTLSVVATGSEAGLLAGPRQVTRSAAGLGVDGLVELGSHRIDGLLGNETLTLTFDRAVTLSGFSVSGIDRPDAILGSVDGLTVGPYTFANLVPDSGNAKAFTLSVPLVGTVFNFSVAPSGRLGIDELAGYSLTGVTATAVPVVEAAPVPLPAAVWGGIVLLGGSGGLRALRRRRQAVAG